MTVDRTLLAVVMGISFWQKWEYKHFLLQYVQCDRPLSVDISKAVSTLVCCQMYNETHYSCGIITRQHAYNIGTSTLWMKCPA